jgi:hypothetical protein
MRTDNRRALMITIAADTSSTNINGSILKGVNGGFRGPFWPDLRYEYIPVPETRMYQTEDGKWKWTGEYVEGGKETYESTLGYRLKSPLVSSIPFKLRKKLMNAAVHHDPRFRKGELTYGDGQSEGRGKQLAKLNPDDLLVFCPSLENPETGDRGRFIMGYFTVKEVFNFVGGEAEFKKKHERDRSEIIDEYKNKNAHFSDAFARAWGWKNQGELQRAYLGGKKEDRDLVLVTGKENESGLLRKCIKITKPRDGKNFVMPTNLVESLGLKTPARPLAFDRGWKWIEGKTYFKSLTNLLEQGDGFL